MATKLQIEVITPTGTIKSMADTVTPAEKEVVEMAVKGLVGSGKFFTFVDEDGHTVYFPSGVIDQSVFRLIITETK